MAAGQSKLTITIDAVDKATKKILKVNDAMSKTLRPVNMLGRNLKNMGNAFKQNPMVEAFSKIAGAAKKAGLEIYNAGRRVAEFVGVGSIAAIAAVASEWGRLGFEIARTSLILGVTTEQLQRFRTIGQLGGVGADTAVQAYQNLGQTIQGARYGRDNNARALFAKFGMRDVLDRNKPVDADKTMTRLASVFGPNSPMNAQAKQFYASMLGISGLLPVLERGPEYMKRMIDLGHQTGSIMSPEQTKKAGLFGEKIMEAKLAVGGLKNAIAAGLQPVLQPMIEQFTRWEIANKGVISADVTKYAKGLLIVLKSTARTLNVIVNLFGGWQNVLKALGVILAISILSPFLKIGFALTRLALVTVPAAITVFVSLNAVMGAAAPAIWAVVAALAALYLAYEKLHFGEGLGGTVNGERADVGAAGPRRKMAGDAATRQRGEYIAGKMKGRGYSDAQIGGVIQGLLDESTSFDANAENQGHVGIQQLDRNRQALFRSLYGHDAKGDFPGQVRYMLDQMEPGGSESMSGWDLRRTNTPESAYDSFRSNNERAPGTHVHVTIVAPAGTHADVQGATTVHKRRVSSLPAAGYG